MVAVNKNLPEPPNSPEETFTTNDEIILPPESDSDDDDVNYGGYNLLHLSSPDNPEESSESEDEEEHEIVTSTVDANQESVVNEEEVAEAKLQSASVAEIPMDSNKVNEVKQAMLNVVLPPTSVPEWAKHIPEEEWTQHLINRLNNLQNK